MASQTFDVVVVGSGSGLAVAEYASAKGMKVAVAEEGPFGGTCLNRGCIPSKMLIHSADVAEQIRGASRFGIDAEITHIDFRSIVDRVTKSIDADSRRIAEAVAQDPNITVFRERAVFVGERTLRVGDEQITGDKVFIVAGARAMVPRIEGLEGTPFLTSREALRLDKQPAKLTIIGGGYVGVELGHFFGGLGTQVTILQRGPSLITNEDEEIAKKFTERFSAKYAVKLNHPITSVAYDREHFTVVAGGERFVSDQLLVATGVTSNADRLDVERAGVAVDARGYVRVNEYFETTAKNIWAFGDIIGKHLLKHSANWEANFAVASAFRKKIPVDYSAMPHAIFSSPQVAGVGATEQELQSEGREYLVGRYPYSGVGMGEALREEYGFVKVLTDTAQENILGCHVMGPEASILIQEVVLAMKTGRSPQSIRQSIHVHPALTEVIQRAFQAVGK